MDASNPTFHPKSLVQAAAWRSYLFERELLTTAEFEQWLAADPRHQSAWVQMSEPWDALGEQLNSPDMIVRRRQALGHARAANHRHSRHASFAEYGKRYAWAAGVVLTVAGALATWMALKPEVYRTELGERRVVTLEDGSRLTLDSSTEVSVEYSDAAREFKIIRGQARFDVARDVERPFAVSASGQKVIAMGTAFNVDLLGRSLYVTLLEGRVAIVDLKTRRSRELKPGERLTGSSSGSVAVSAANLDNITAWEDGQLIFIGEPLAAVVERINRYTSRTIEVGDERAAALKMSGVFNVGEVDRFITTVTEYLPVTVEPGRSDHIVLRYRPSEGF